MFIRVWNFTLHSTPLVTGCSDISAAPAAGNIVWNLQRQCCQGRPAILVEPLQRQQNTSLLAKNKMVFVSYLLLVRYCSLRLLFVPRNELVFGRFAFFPTWLRFNENCWWPLIGFLLKILDNVSSSGSDTGIAASNHRGGTWKGTKVSNLYDYFKYFF